MTIAIEVYDHDGERLAKFTLPASVRLEAIRQRLKLDAPPGADVRVRGVWYQWDGERLHRHAPEILAL